MTQVNGSTRLDILLLAHAVAALAPAALTIPVTGEGKRTFRLGPLCRANGVKLDEANAHDALADVRATMALAKFLKELAPNAFAATVSLADRSHVSRVIDGRGVVLVLKMIGGEPIVRPIIPIGALSDDRNAVICVDLAVDTEDFWDCSDAELTRAMEVWPAPIFVLRANAMPLVFRYSSAYAGIDNLRDLIGRHAGARPPSATELKKRAERILNDRAFIARVHALIVAQSRARVKSVLIEEQLYDGFVDRLDFAYARKLHEELPWQRAELTPFLRDDRLREHAMRMVHETWPAALPDATRQRLDEWRRERIIGPTNAPWRTVAAARAELAELMNTAKTENAGQLQELASYLDAIEASVTG